MKKEQKNNSVEQLKNYMIDSNPKTVEEWNVYRSRAMNVYSQSAIGSLDASGLINSLVKTSNPGIDERE